MELKRLLNKNIFKMCFLLEKHSDCSCSYCSELEHSSGALGVKLPKDKSRNSWRYLFLQIGKSNLYLRWTLPRK